LKEGGVGEGARTTRGRGESSTVDVQAGVLLLPFCSPETVKRQN